MSGEAPPVDPTTIMLPLVPPAGELGAIGVVLGTKSIRIVRAIQIWVAVAYGIAIWDWLMTLGDERKLWKTKTSPIKVLFLVERYWTLVVFAVPFMTMLGEWDADQCEGLYRTVTLVCGMMLVFADAILLIRAWALWEKNMIILYGGIVALVGQLATMISSALMSTGPSPIPPGTLKFACSPQPLPHHDYIFAFWLYPFGMDCVLTGLSLYRVFAYRSRGGNSSVLDVLFRDGLYYFVAVSAVNAVNVSFFALDDELLRNLHGVSAALLTSVCAQRLVLSLRASQLGGISHHSDSHTSNPNLKSGTAARTGGANIGLGSNHAQRREYGRAQGSQQWSHAPAHELNLINSGQQPRRGDIKIDVATYVESENIDSLEKHNPYHSPASTGYYNNER